MPNQYTASLPFPERFWSKVDKSGECWVWTGARSSTGYGVASVRRGKLIGAHRAAWELTHGPIPAGMYVCHNCPGGDNRACVRPDHLWLGTNDDNMVDMAKKGRHKEANGKGMRAHPEQAARGERAGATKLTTEQVLRIRQEAGTASHAGLARRYGVTASTVAAIIHRKNWRHV